MKKVGKLIQTRRAAIVTAISERPGITTAELASVLGVEPKVISNAVWTVAKAGKVVSERIVRDGTHMNAYYLPEQVSADTVERINQKLVDASNVLPIAKSAASRNSAFDVPRRTRSAKKRGSRRSAIKATVTPIAPATVPTPSFACAIASDGSLVLMREGRIQFSLSDVEAVTLRRYLLKAATASALASMA